MVVDSAEANLMRSMLEALIDQLLTDAVVSSAVATRLKASVRSR